jgi:ABC-2 type transport system permease protein
MNRIKAILIKEWLDASKNKMIMYTMVLVPLLVLLIALGTMFALSKEVGGSLNMGGQKIPAYLAGLAPVDAVSIMLAQQFLFMFLIVPASIPVTIASYSIVGEKEGKSLEPLLATPIRTWELLVAKSIAAVAPAAVIGWLVYGLYVAGVALIASPLVLKAVVDPIWLVANVVAGPMLAMLSVLLGIIASSRMNDPRAVQQMVAFLVVPIILIGVGNMSGIFLVSLPMISLATVGLAAIDLGIFYAAIRLFQRETILTRWR